MGIIKLEGESMKERLFITPEYTTAGEIREIRKSLHLTQKEFAEFINCSKPTVERWERSKEVIRGPIVSLLKMLQRYPEYDQYLEFLKSRCFPESRDKMKLILRDLGLPFYDPIMIIEKTEGRMAEDNFWIRIER